MIEQLDELGGCLVTMLVKILFELVDEVLLNRFIFQFEDRMNG